jgi:catechol O-methyltransferase
MSHACPAQVELGGGCGYSAVRVARWLGEGGVLHSVDPDPLSHAVKMALAAAAAVAGKVRPALARSSDWLRAFEAAGHNARSVDFLLIDHGAPHLYKKDLELALKLDLLAKGCVVVADKVGRLHADDYARFVKNDARFRTTSHATTVEYTHADPDELLVSVYRGRRSDAYAA